MTDDKPPFGPEVLNLTFNRLLCARHGETFKYKWPLGYPSWMLFSFQKYEGDGNLIEICKDAKNIEERNRAIEAHLDEKPVCCRLTAEEVYTIWLEIHKHETSSPWKRAPCKGCKKFMVGGPYETVSKTHGHQRHKHLCLRCILFRMQRDSG